MRSLRVRVLALPGVVTFDLASAVQILQSGPAARPLDGVELLVCAERPGPVATSDGLELGVLCSLDRLEDADLVVVPAALPHDVTPSHHVLEALSAANARGTTIASICLGAFVLGYAGLLDGRRATTHWAAGDELARLFPTAQVEPRALYIDDGDVVTSAGLAAGLDMCLHLVRRHFGAAVALEVASWNVLAPHREGGQAQFIPQRPAAATEGSFAETLSWALEHLDEPLPVSRLASHAKLGERTFARRFREQVGTSPKQWVLAHRVRTARELLETTDHSLDRVARATGLGSAAALRYHLRRSTDMSPTNYRRTFATRI